MLFASFAYLLAFLPIAVLGAMLVRRLRGPRAAQIWVLLASIFFYAKSNPLNLLYLFGSILANWLFARWMARTAQPDRKRILISALTLNVVYLCAFKYLGFLGSILAPLLARGFAVPALGFPLGISFFTITQVMYLVDCYETSVKAGTLLDHASFVCFFPYLISGPLGKAKRMRKQFGDFGGPDGRRTELLARGLYLFALGLFKKTVFADSFGQVANFGATLATRPSLVETWVFGISYTMQIYFDFSGYSDMAIGSALMLGVEIPRNFDRPFAALSITEFWQRWHISLTGFITGYLFTPMFKSFKNRGLLASSVATLLAMAIAGVWHGAGWQFFLYGSLHGAYLVINQVWNKQNKVRLPDLAAWLITFVGVIISFAYFGAPNASTGTARLLQFFNLRAGLSVANLRSPLLLVDGYSFPAVSLVLLAALLIAIFGASSEQRGRDFQPTLRNGFYAAALTAVSLLLVNSTISVPFVYFKF